MEEVETLTTVKPTHEARLSAEREAVRSAPAHKFHLGQAVEFNPPRGVYAPRGHYVVTAKLPEREGTFEYRIRSAIETHERLARESELRAMADNDDALAGKGKR